MSTQLAEPNQTNGHDQELKGVRTYRGRKLEDLIPQIRAELGPDAIILRQREGLMGGVGGFFAQKCVEVDAQAGLAAPRIDIYDDDEPINGWDEGLEDFVVPTTTPELPPVAQPTPVVEPPAPVVEPPAPVVEPAAPVVELPAPVAQAPIAPATEELSAESFVGRLEEAAAHVDIDELVKLVTSGRVLGSEPAADVVTPPAPATQPIVPPAPAPAPAAPAPAPVVVPAPVVEAPAPAPVPSPVAPAHAANGTQPPAANPWVAKQPGELDSDAATAVAAELTAQGLSESWAQRLIVAAAAHRSPLAKGTLRDAVRATLATTIPAPAALPASGAAVAFVGAGGAGKTRCAAALASAYAKGSTLASSVVSLGGDDWGGDLKELLKGQNVWVMGAASSADAAPAVQHGRDGGLVVLDTVAATPRDPGSVESLAHELRSLALDAIYIAVPATFSVHAARKLLDGFAALGADGIVVTHADEADQLGIAAELSQISGLPVAYIHEGLELDGALSAADPSTLAARLLP